MGHKLFDLGLFVFLAATFIPSAAIVGSVLMVVGLVLEFMDK